MEHSFIKTMIEKAAEGLCICYRIPEHPFIRFTLWNERMVQITGYTMDEINRLGWYQTLYPDPEIQALALERMNQMREGLDLHNEKWEITRSDGQQRILNISTSVLKNEDGVNHILALMHDQTEERLAQEELKRAHEELERKVAGRTAELRAVNVSLKQQIGKRKQVEKALRDSEHELRQSRQELKSILETSPDIIYRLDPQGKIVFINEAVKEYGYLPEELIGKDIFELVHPDDRKKAFYAVRERRTGHRRTKSFEVRLLTKKHTPVLFELKSKPVKNHITCLIDAEGIYYSEKPKADSFAGTQGIARDISDRKRMEKKLRESESMKRAILDGITTNLTFVNDRLEILWVNKAAAASVNTSPQEMIGRKCYEFWTDPEIPCNDCPTVRAFKTQKTEEGIMQTPDGRIWAEKGEPVFDDQNQLMGVLEIAYDITEKAKSLADLKESEEKYRRVIENSNDAIFIAQDGGIKFPNPMTEKITGCSAKELAGIPFINFIHPDDREMVLERHARRLKGEKPPSTYSFRIINNSGEKLWVQLNVVTTMWEGRPATLNFLRDISVEKRLHARLLHAQKMEAIATLTGGIAHDFNNLLSIILGNISLAEDEIKTGSEAIRFLKEAETASLRAAELTNRLTSFSTGETPVKKTGSINDVVKETAAAIFKDADASYELTLPDDPWPVEFDKRQIKQALEHVFLNAVEFSPNQAAVKITIDNLMIFEANGYNLTLPEGRYIKITIEDQGIGIPEENLLKIFDPYFSTKEMGAQKGMGLGLTLSRSVIEKHDGMITVESKPGMGSVFRIYLPAYESETSLHIPIQPPRPKPSPDSVKRILIMDDEKMIRKLCGNFLRRTNYEAEFAKNGEEAVELYKQAMILHKPFDAVILDLTVKRGMSGKTALKKILELDPYAKAIISSGYSTESVMEHFNQYGFMGVLIKPFSKNEFIKELHRVMSV